MNEIERKVVNEFSKNLKLERNDILLLLFLGKSNGDPNSTNGVFGRTYSLTKDEVNNCFDRLTKSKYITTKQAEFNSNEILPILTENGIKASNRIVQATTDYQIQSVSQRVGFLGWVQFVSLLVAVLAFVVSIRQCQLSETLQELDLMNSYELREQQRIIFQKQLKQELKQAPPVAPKE